jgi:hypothetical protein
MSLLTSLIQAGAQFQQAMEKRQALASADGSTNTGRKAASANADKPSAEQASSATDDRFTSSGNGETDPFQIKARKLTMADYKQTVGQDLAFVRETLRHKLAEYQLSPASKIEVSRDDNGGIRLGGNLPPESSARIEQDLNNNRPFREAFSRLSASEPTLHFMDNALKLNKAYGVSNSLLDTITSENQQFNGLQDLVHRYDSVRRSVAAGDNEAYRSAKSYAFSLNTLA